MSEETYEDRRALQQNHWHLDKRVPVSIIIVLLVQMIAGIWSYAEAPDHLGFSRRTVKWLQRPVGRHIELGISETNLFLLLGQLGLAGEQRA